MTPTPSVGSADSSPCYAGEQRARARLPSLRSSPARQGEVAPKASEGALSADDRVSATAENGHALETKSMSAMSGTSGENRSSGHAPLTGADFAEAARRLRTEPARIRAVIAVESAGRGFHPSTGRPVILFEPHVFHRETEGRHARARPDLSYPSWGARAYPRTQAERWRQLAAAAALDERAALRSASWGLFQIMGFNHRPCGFNTAQAFAAAQARSERDQLLSFCAFLQSRGLDAALREGRWSDFARAYNGPAYARHAYDQRLKTAYARAAGQGVSAA